MSHASAVDGGHGAARASSPGGERAPGADPLVRVVFALLVVACFAAFLITQRLKHTPAAVQKFELATAFDPYPGSRVTEEAISFKLAKAGAVTVTIVGSGGSTVATLVREYPVARYKQFSLRWNGRRGIAHSFGHTLSPHGRPILLPQTTGGIAPPGEYRVRVSLRGRSLPVYSPRSFTLVKSS